MTTPVCDSPKPYPGRPFAAACLAVLLAVVPLAAGAQMTDPGTLTVDTTSMAIPEAPELVIEDGAIRLGLEDAVSIALSRNLDIAIQRYSRESALYGVQSANGLFDLRAALDVEYSTRESPTFSQVEGVPVLQNDNQGFSGSLNQLTAFGGEASLTFSGNRRSTNSQDVPVQPDYGASARLSFTQPLLRDFGWLPTHRDVLIARLSSNISRE
ncbi:MAG TPA: hypothetical protein VKU40_07565, partial [Thermoanaerobaculia bacterium]|nr:hypothetical protein [Thermoanaerobaculia bacterium]